MKSAIYAYLSTVTGIVALVGTRIYPMTAPTSAVLPYIILNQISGLGQHHMGAASEYVKSRWQIDCFGSTALGAFNVAEAVRDAIDGFQGDWGTVNIRRCHQVDENDGINFAVDGSEIADYRHMAEYEIDYFRSVPTLAT